jgi:hypothetical protein
MREKVFDILSEIGDKLRFIKDENCFEAVGEICRFILTLFVHEGINDGRLVYMILHVSSNLYTK